MRTRTTGAMPARRRASLVLAAWLAGCTVAGPDYQRPQAPVPAAFRQAGAGGSAADASDRAQTDSTPPAAPPGWKFAEPQPAGGAPGDARRWWRVFGDETLDALAEAADRDSFTIAQAHARYRQAQALLAAAGAARLPSVQAGASATRSRAFVAGGGVTGNTLRASASAAWEVDLWGRVARALESQQASAQASAYDVEAARLSVQAALAQAYFQVRASDALRRLFESTVSAYERSLAVTRNRYEAGVVPRSDVSQAETQVGTVRAQLIDVGIQRAQAEHAIAVLLGKPPSAFALAANDLSFVAPEVPTGLPSALLERRPDVAAAERRVAAANAEIGVARAAYFPTLSLGASIGSQGSTLADLFSLPHRVWSLGPALAATLFDAGLRDARVAQAQAAYDGAVAGYRQTVLTAIQEVEDALVVLRLLREEATVLAQTEAAAAEALAQVTNQYRAGTVSILNLISAQAALLSARRASVDVRTRQVAAVVRLVSALGGRW